MKVAAFTFAPFKLMWLCFDVAGQTLTMKVLISNSVYFLIKSFMEKLTVDQWKPLTSAAPTNINNILKAEMTHDEQPRLIGINVRGGCGAWSGVAASAVSVMLCT